MKPNPHLLRASIPLAALLVLGGAAAYSIATIPPKPIIKCDPKMLTAGIPVDDIKVICGEPTTRMGENIGEWYPIHGETRSDGLKRDKVTLIYGPIGGVHTNLYFEGGTLRNVQVFGDGK